MPHWNMNAQPILTCGKSVCAARVSYAMFYQIINCANINKKERYQSIPKSEHNNMPTMCNHIFSWIHSWIVSFRYIRRHHIWQLFLIQSTLIILCVYINSHVLWLDVTVRVTSTQTMMYGYWLSFWFCSIITTKSHILLLSLMYFCQRCIPKSFRDKDLCNTYWELR